MSFGSDTRPTGLEERERQTDLKGSPYFVRKGQGEKAKEIRAILGLMSLRFLIYASHSNEGKQYSSEVRQYSNEGRQ
jgi:hypothetical protein